MREVHNIQPIYDENSRILILGSFPSVKSREIQFFYGHPQNRFWRIMERLFSTTLNTIEEKKIFLISNNIALWDTIGSCEIKGSADDTIENIVPNDLSLILDNSKVERIFCNGAKSYDLYMKHIYPKTEIKPTKLPSTSPANATWSLDRLCGTWKEILV